MPSYPQNRAQAQTAVHDNVEDVEMDNRSKSKKGDVRIQEKEASSNESPAMTIAEVPDGGLKAWLVVAGSMFAMISSFGYIYSWGVFQSYYQQVLLKDNNASDIAWIGSIQNALGMMPTVFAGRLLDKGILKIPFFISSVILVGATVLVGQCTKYWHFLLCQGIVSGLASGMIVGPAMSIIPHWFEQKRGKATAFMAVGSALGGIIFPIAVRKLIPIVGFPWTMRIIALILLCCLVIPNLTLATHLSPKPHSGLFDFASFKKPPFAAYGLTVLFAFIGVDTVLTYIDISAVSAGLSSDMSFYLVSIANAGSGVGRFISGFLTDRYGAITTMVPMTVFASVITYIWPFAKSEAGFVVIAALYGFLGGAYISVFSVPVFMLDDSDTADVGRRVGMFLCIASLGALCGPPISGAINKASGGFEDVGFYAGTMTLVASLFMVLTKRLVLGTWLGKY
ncbi:MFS general substrate transporter [Gymnopus androsaceus JB14]|uniref:MFS general substrate transporter n=1 Tax=Gymnopus androsaceus JB14 TaxID=1447944 RepID=A0A6A4GZB7_9AGAR|nr:MFS general substrate transporter [Gymnopus androsaceus JB14]